MDNWIWDCDLLQEMINIPDTRVTHIGNDNIIRCEVDPVEPPMCQEPGCHGYGIRGGMTPTKHIVYDIVGNNPPRLLKLDIHHRRFTCSQCGQEIPLQSDVLAKGVKSTKRLDSWITEQCINNSPKIVSEQLDKVISPTTIADIFDRTASARIASYAEKLLPPALIGVHYIPFKKKALVFVTDVDRCYVLDAFWSQPDLTAFLKAMKSSNKCVTDIRTDCLVPVRGTISMHPDSIVVASHESAYREISSAYVEFINDYYTGQRPSIVRQFFSQPLDKPVARYELENIRNLFYTATNAQVSHLKEVLETFLAVRKLFLENLRTSDLDKWLSDIKDWPDFTELYDRILFAKLELGRSFIRKQLQAPYDSITAKVLKILNKCSKCSDKTLRYRILLAFPPRTTSITANGITKTYYLGVSLDDLEQLPPYNA